MTRGFIVRGAIAAVIVLVAVAAGFLLLRRGVPANAPTPLATALPPSAAPPETALPAEARPTAESSQGLLYGRITAVDGSTYEGRLRWGGSEEAFWDDAFNGVKSENAWLAQIPLELRPVERHPIELFGLVLAQRERPSAVGRPFQKPFGEIVRLEASGDEVQVTLKDGSVVALNRFDASDFDDDVRVWDATRGVADLDTLRVRVIELLPTPALAMAPSRLYGTVRTQHGDFTGFIGWNRDAGVGSDEIAGRGAAGSRRLRLDTVRAIARRSPDSSEVTLLDGSASVLSGSADVGNGNRGICIADRRYGRVLVPWETFVRVDFSPQGDNGSGAAYGDFPPGSPLAGSVTTRGGSRFAGRLVFDLDESATTDALDAPAQGIDYAIPFGRIASISALAPLAPSGRDELGGERARVLLQSGEELQLERSGDLGEENAGLLIFVAGGERPEYLPWSEVERVDFDRPQVIAPPLAER